MSNERTLKLFLFIRNIYGGLEAPWFSLFVKPKKGSKNSSALLRAGIWERGRVCSLAPAQPVQIGAAAVSRRDAPPTIESGSW